MTYLIGGGYAMAVVLLCGVVVLVVAARALAKGTPPQQSADTVLLWGGAALAIGFVGTLIGVSNVATAMAAAGAGAPAALAWDGIRIALSPTLAGTTVFLVALACCGVVLRRSPRA